MMEVISVHADEGGCLFVKTPRSLDCDEVSIVAAVVLMTVIAKGASLDKILEYYRLCRLEGVTVQLEADSDLHKENMN